MFGHVILMSGFCPMTDRYICLCLTGDLPGHMSINNTSVTSQSTLRSSTSVATSMDQQSVAVDIQLVDK